MKLYRSCEIRRKIRHSILATRLLYFYTGTLPRRSAGVIFSDTTDVLFVVVAAKQTSNKKNEIRKHYEKPMHKSK